MSRHLPPVWAPSWLADGLGVLVFGSGCLAIWTAWRAGRRSTAGGAEGAGLGVATLVTSGLGFLSPPVSPPVLFPLPLLAGGPFAHPRPPRATPGSPPPPTSPPLPAPVPS